MLIFFGEREFRIMNALVNNCLLVGFPDTEEKRNPYFNIFSMHGTLSKEKEQQLEILFH